MFALSGAARRNRRQTFGFCEAELRKDAAYVCIRGSAANLNRPLADIIAAAHSVAQNLLDIVAVEERTALSVAEPRDNVVWRTGPHGLKLQLTSSITMTAEMGDIRAVVRNAAECSTIEQLMAEGGKQELPDGGSFPVRFTGRDGPATDEWVLVSEIKPQDLHFSRVAALRLVAPPNDHVFLGVIANKMNRTVLGTDLDLAGLAKFVVRVLCVLRNRQSPKRGFSH